MPSGMSSVRDSASRPSRSTIRSTTSSAIRRQVVSLPPVIVSIPDEVSYSSALREMSTDFFGSPAEISGPHAGERARDVVGGQLQLQVLVDRVQQVGDVVAARRHVVDVAVVVVVGGPDHRPPVPGQDHHRALLPRRDDERGVADGQVVGRERDVRAAAGCDPRDLLLGQDLVGPDAVGPDAGRVDDVRGLDLEALARLRLGEGDAGGAAVLIEDLGHVGAVQQHRPEALGLAQDRQAPAGRRRSGSRRRGRPSWARAARGPGPSRRPPRR